MLRWNSVRAAAAAAAVFAEKRLPARPGPTAGDVTPAATLTALERLVACACVIWPLWAALFKAPCAAAAMLAFMPGKAPLAAETMPAALVGHAATSAFTRFRTAAMLAVGPSLALAAFTM